MEELLVTSTAAQLLELEAIATLEPWGERQADWRVAVLCSAVQNAACSKVADCRSPDDYMKLLRPEVVCDVAPDHDPRDDQLAAALMSLTIKRGGEISGHDQ